VSRYASDAGPEEYDLADGRPTPQDVEERVYEKAAMLLPKGSRAEVTYEEVTCAPVIHLFSATVGRELFDKSPPEVHVIMWAVDSRSRDRCVGGTVSWPAKEGSASPVWNSARQLAVGVSDPGAQLHIELWATQTDAALAAAKIPLHSLLAAPIDVPLLRPDDGEGGPPRHTPRGGSAVRLHALPAPSPMKTVFFVRHGESKWNEAQAKRDVLEMVSQVDHPLNEKGYKQACELQRAIRAAADGGRSMLSSSPSEAAALRALLGAQAVWASPLTRAIQTAVVAMRPLLEKGDGPPPELMLFGADSSSARLSSDRSSDGGAVAAAAAAGSSSGSGDQAAMELELKTNAREKKNVGGRDTQGLVVGAACAQRARQKLAEVAPGAERFGDGIKFNFDEVSEPWWNTSAEARDEVRGRLLELLYQIQFSRHDTIVIVGHSHFFRSMFQRFLHADVGHRSTELASRLCKDVLPNCGVACCQLDFSRGPRMITDVRLLVAAQTPNAGVKLVMQRQFEQPTGPVVHLTGVNHVPLFDLSARVQVTMWLADSSGVHIGRQAAWPAATAHATSPDDAKALADAKGKRNLRPGLVWRGRCTWNSARRLGQSHWGADTVLHLAVRSGKDSALLASAEVPMGCVGAEELELGALTYAPSRWGGPPTSDGSLGPPCTITLRSVAAERPVKHLFLLHTAQSTWSEAYRTMLRAAGMEEPSARASGGTGAVGEQTQKLKERLGGMAKRGQEAYQRMRAVMAKTDHPLSRIGYMQAERVGAAIRASAALSGVARSSAADGDGGAAADEEQRAALLSLLQGTHALWSSPLTRAVQTAQLALLPLLEAAGVVEVKANARQRRGLTNPNMSIGTVSGDAMRHRCVEKFRELAASEQGLCDEASLEQIEASELDTVEAEARWWSDKTESERDFQARVAELVSQIRYSPHESLVLVTHDDVFHELLGRHTHTSAHVRQGPLLKQMTSGSVPSCQLLWCCMDFGREHAQPITDVVDMSSLLQVAMPQQPRRGRSVSGRGSE